MVEGTAKKVKRGRARAVDLPTTLGPIEIAMEAQASGKAPKGIAHSVLAEHVRLIRWQIDSERAGFALKALTTIAGLSLAVLLAIMSWDASRSAALVIDAFSVPPDLAQRGLTGQVVASRILDRMIEIQSGIDSQRAPSSFTRAWDGGIEVQIPQTGVTLGELKRALRETLGHDTHIAGELVRNASGLSLTVRAGGQSGVTFSGTDDEIDMLLRRAGESAFERTEPYRYGVYLRAHDLQQAELLFRRLAAKGPPGERAWAYIGVGNNAKDLHGSAASLAVFKSAEALAPALSLPPQNIGILEVEIGHPEAARAASRRAERTVNERGEVRPTLREALRLRILGTIAQIDGDYKTSLQAWLKAGAYGPQGMNQSLNARVAASHIGLHELSAARVDLQRPDPALSFPTGTRALDLLVSTVRLLVEQQAWAEALTLGDGAKAILAKYPGVIDQKRSQLDPLIAYARARSGDLAGAQVLIATTPLDSYDAVMMRGRIAELANDSRTADHWFGQAVKMAPSVPFAYQAWAESRLARGDVAGAIAQAAQAHRASPNFADPLELWGEALQTQGDARGAAAKFAQAAKFAPRWGRLHLQWGESLAKFGKANEAKAKWRAAAGMDLPAAGRARVNQLLAGHF